MSDKEINKLKQQLEKTEKQKDTSIAPDETAHRDIRTEAEITKEEMRQKKQPPRYQAQYSDSYRAKVSKKEKKEIFDSDAVKPGSGGKY